MDCVPRFGHESEREVALGIELFADQYRSELEMADRVLVAERVTAELLQRTTGVPIERFQVQPLPYQRRFEGLDRPDSSRAFRFGYWGGLTAHKGPHILLQAFREVVAAANRPVELYVFGPLDSAEIPARLVALATDLPVTFHGAFDAADLVAAGLDAAVFPAVCFEGFGLGLTEAFELGLPSIVSDIGALAGRIGKGGLKVPVGDVASLAAAMTRIRTDADLRAECVRNIPALPYPPADHAVELHAHYVDVVGGGRRAPRLIDPERRAQLPVSQREAYATALRNIGRGTQPR
jgi:glycosyltransferase involved in cell wall biosynthesis